MSVKKSNSKRFSGFIPKRTTLASISKIEQPVLETEKLVASIHLIKIMAVRSRRINLGITAKELSFLLGKRTTFVSEAEDPFTTLKYGIDDTVYLSRILRCPISKLYESIEELPHTIKVIRKLDQKVGSFRYSIPEPKELASKMELVISEIEEDFDSVESKATPDEIIGEVEVLFEKGFFDVPKTAFEAYEECTAKFGFPIKPEYLSQALQKYTRKKGFPRLDSKLKSEGFARTLYQKVESDLLIDINLKKPNNSKQG